MVTSVLPELYATLSQSADLDLVDWKMSTQYAETWKLSVVDALLDLHFVNETILAKCLAHASNLTYHPGSLLIFDFSGVGFEFFDDLMSVGAAPLENQKLAICNPYEDLHGLLDVTLCQRELIVSERSTIIDALRNYALNGRLGHAREYQH